MIFLGISTTLPLRDLPRRGVIEFSDFRLKESFHVFDHLPVDGIQVAVFRAGKLEECGGDIEQVGELSGLAFWLN